MFIARFFDATLRQSHESGWNRDDDDLCLPNEDEDRVSQESLRLNRHEGDSHRVSSFSGKPAGHTPSETQAGNATWSFERLWEDLEGIPNWDIERADQWDVGNEEGSVEKAKLRSLSDEEEKLLKERKKLESESVKTLMEFVGAAPFQLEGDSEAEFYRVVELLLNSAKVRQNEEAQVLEKLQVVELPDLAQAAREGAEQQIISWMAASSVLNHSVNLIGASALAPMFEEKTKEILEAPLLRLQILMGVRHYVATLKRCLQILESAQRLLTSPKDGGLECLKTLAPLPSIFKQEAQRNGSWIFQESTRRFLARKMEFILSVLIANYTQALHFSLEEIGWGTLRFEALTQV